MRSRSRIILAAVIVAALGVEFFLLFVNRHGEFVIEGKDAYDLTDFGSGSVVSHAFLMRGDGLNAVRLHFHSNTKTAVTIHWTLWRGFADEPKEMARAFEGDETFELRPGRQWKRLTFTRDASSRDRWYTIEVRLVAPKAADLPEESRPQIALVASRDNPERGGVLFVDGVRKPGSLMLGAERMGRTISRRFAAEVEPHLPSVLRIAAVQWLIVIVFHWAFVVFAYAVVSEGESPAAPYEHPARARV